MPSVLLCSNCLFDCPGRDPWLPSCSRPREQRPQEAQPWHPRHVQLQQQQLHLNEWVLHRALGALPGGLNGIASAHTTVMLTGLPGNSCSDRHSLNPWDSSACLERLGFPVHSFWHCPSRGGQQQEGQWLLAPANAPGTRTPPSLGSHSTERCGVFGSLPAASFLGALGTRPPQTQPRQLCQLSGRSFSGTLCPGDLTDVQS